MMDFMDSDSDVEQIPELLQIAIRNIRDAYSGLEEHLDGAVLSYNVDYSDEEADCDYVTLPGKFLLIYIRIFNGFYTVTQEQNANKPATDQTTSTTQPDVVNEYPDTEYNTC